MHLRSFLERCRHMKRFNAESRQTLSTMRALVVPIVVSVLFSACSGGGSAGGSAGSVLPGGGSTTTPLATSTILASGLSAPGNIIVDTATQQLYWIDSVAGTVRSSPTSGGSGIQFPALTDGSTPFDIAQDTLNVYITYVNASGKIAKIVKPFTVGESETFLASAPSATWAPCLQTTTFPSLCGIKPGGIVSSNGLYYAESFGGGIGTIPVNGTTTGNVTTVYGPSGGVGPLYWLAADTGGLYIAPEGSGSSTIQYVSQTGTVIGSSGTYNNIHGLVTGQASGLGSSQVFFIELGTGTLYQLQIVGSAGGSAKRLALNAGSTTASRALAVDANCVYFATQGQIGRVPIQSATGTGGPFTPTIIVNTANAAGPAGLAVDNNNVYWTATGNGTGNGSVRSFPKPASPPC